MIETSEKEELGEQRLIRTFSQAAEQVFEQLTKAKPQLRWARQAAGSQENLATLEWWEAKYEAAGEHCIWIGMPGPVGVEIGRLAQVLASAGGSEPQEESLPAQQTVESLCGAFAKLLASETGKAFDFKGLRRLDEAPSPEVIYSTEVALSPGTPASILVGCKTATNTTFQQWIEHLPGSTRAASTNPDNNGPLGLLLDLELPLSVRFGSAQMTLERVLELRPGSVVELEGSQDDPVDVLVNGSVVARGEVVAVDGQYAIRVKEILSRDCKIAPSRPSSEDQGA